MRGLALATLAGSGARRPTSLWTSASACKPGAFGHHARRHNKLAACGPARSPFFCRDLLHHVNLQIALHHESAEPGVLQIEILEALDIIAGYLIEPSAPCIDPLLAHGMPISHARHRIFVHLSQNLYDLLVGKLALLYGFRAAARKLWSHDSIGLKNPGQVTGSRAKS